MGHIYIYIYIYIFFFFFFFFFFFNLYIYARMQIKISYIVNVSVNEDLEPSQMQPVRAAPPPVAPKPGPPAVHYGDYNPKLKAWHSPEPSMSSPSEYGGRVWTPTSNDSYYMNGSGGVSPNILSPTGYHPPPGGLYSAQPMSPEPHYQHMYNGGYAGYTQAQEALPGSDL